MRRASFIAGSTVGVLLCTVLLAQYASWPSGTEVADKHTAQIVTATAALSGEAGQALPVDNPVVLAPAPPEAQPIRPSGLDLQQSNSALAAVNSNLEPSVYGFPTAFIELVQLVVNETNNGNHTAAALAALDAIEISREYPEKHEFLHQMAGLNYEQVGLVDFAIEQYRMALALNPEQRSSYEGLRRLDDQFRASHPPLPDAVATDAENVSTEHVSTEHGTSSVELPETPKN